MTISCTSCKRKKTDKMSLSNLKSAASPSLSTEQKRNYGNGRKIFAKIIYLTKDCFPEYIKKLLRHGPVFKMLVLSEQAVFQNGYEKTNIVTGNTCTKHMGKHSQNRKSK